ncbi:GNAT family N-acetyltransferase [Bacillus tropicus]|uniref:GNAT family N-acetyltransferase n=1 Tax=Bacillus tropicus TaxID=2026188 RepID=UPI003D2529D9
MGKESLPKLFRIDCGDIYLQEFTITDAESIYNISNQPEIEKFLPDWKSTKEQRINWVVNYEIPENKAFLHAVKTTTNIDEHILRLGIFKKTTIALINNVASNKVIEKCRFTYLDQQTIENQIYNHYVLSKSEWIKNSAL